MTCGSLFAGIGGFDLGFERAGIKTIWQVEIDEYCRRVLARHFPDAERFGDIRECGGHNLKAVDVITGGFPCQPFSTAGRRKGTSDNRYLWPEMLRVISALRPKYIVAENVFGITVMQDGTVIDQICDTLEAENYETIPPIIVPACAFGAPHRRDRVWILAHARYHYRSAERQQQQEERPKVTDSGGAADVAYSNSMWQLQPQGSKQEQRGWSSYGCNEVYNSNSKSLERATKSWTKCNPWIVEPELGRLANGVPNRVDRLRGLGNAVVPQVAEWIGRRIVEASNGS